MRWLLGLTTASFVAYFAFVTFSIHMTREPAGVYFRFESNLTFLSGVVPDSPAERAGLRAGDRIVSIAGIPLTRVLDQRLAVANFPVGAPAVWEVEREGQRQTLVVESLERHFVPSMVAVIFSLSTGLSLVLGIVLAWRRSHDPSALLGAWLLASLSCVMAPILPRSFATLWRELPTPIGAMLWPAAISSLATTGILFAFFAQVPRPILSRRAVALAVAPVGALLIYVVSWLRLVVYDPPGAARFPAPNWLMVAGPLIAPLYFFGALGLVVLNLRRMEDVTDRRRARVLLVGLIAGAIALAPIAATFVNDQFQQSWLAVNPISLSVSILLFSILPLSLTYATVRHRMFDLPIMLRLGLQYALARRLLLALLPVAVGALLIDLWMRGEQPLRAILAERGWIYLTLAAFVVAAYTQRERWLASLDRRFFRERYLAQQVLRQVVDDVARSRALEDAADRVLAKINSALHPTVVALLAREPSAGHFTSIAALPAPSSLPALAADSALIRIARALGRPLTLDSETRGLRRDLPADDQRWLSNTRFELVIPVMVGEGVREVLLALGPRLSEEPYTSEDVELLSAIAGSLALIDRSDSTRERAGLRRRTEVATKLADRYRLDRLIGEGGMGAVWEGVDELLDRPVAVKLLKEEASGDTDAQMRFRREAQAAARLSHHNVVVVHDFGIDAHHPYLVMERLVGCTLRQRLVQERRLAATDAAEVIAGTAAGIDAAHAQKLVHRDLKPENIFLCEGGARPHIKVLDFGIARVTGFSTTSANTSSGAVAGTFLYMGPEQLAGGTPSASWDIWALGVIAYEMLSGAHPLQQPGVATPLTPFDWAQAIATKRLTPLASHLPDAPSSWSVFFERALALDAARRPASALQLATDFRIALGLLDRDERAGGTPIPHAID